MLNFKVGFDGALIPEVGAFGNARSQTVMLTRWLERIFFFGNALDREAICIVAGKLVWHLDVHVRVIDNDGNIGDACVLSVLAALAAHKRPFVTHEQTSDGQVTIRKHPTEEIEPLSLTLHHLPISISFAIYESGMLVDPTLKEISAMTGFISCVGDPQGNILNIQKLHGRPVSASKIISCSRTALDVIDGVAKVLQTALKAHEEQRVKARIIRSDDAEYLKMMESHHTHTIPRQTIDIDDLIR